MEKTTKKVQVTHQVKKEEVCEIYVTSDGREWSLRDKEAAERHEILLADLSAFKKLINYEEKDLPWVDPMGYEKDFSFTFIVPEEGTSRSTLLWKLSEMLRDRKIDTDELLRGKKYVVIQHSELVENPNGCDWYNYSGFFGTVEEYLLQMASEVKQAEQRYLSALSKVY